MKYVAPNIWFLGPLKDEVSCLMKPDWLFLQRAQITKQTLYYKGKKAVLLSEFKANNKGLLSNK